MKFRLFFILILSFIICRSHASEITVELIPDSELRGIGFSCLKVLDARIVKDNIGYVTRGIVDNNTAMQLPEEFDSYLFQTINKLLPKENYLTKLVLIFRNMTVSENIGTMNQYGYCNIEIEFARQVDTMLYSLGTFNSNINEKSNTIKNSHGNRILRGLEDCMRKFDKTDWKENTGMLIRDINQIHSFDYKFPPPKGIYLNYSQMTRKSPLDNINFEIKQVKQTNKFTSFEIDFKDNINPELVQFVSDGSSLYMHTNSNQFLKSSSYGNTFIFKEEYLLVLIPNKQFI